MLKVALLFRNYGPYHFARLAAFAQMSQQQNWQGMGVELARSEADYGWKAEMQNLPCEFVSIFPDRMLETTSTAEVVKRLWQCLSKIRPDVLAIAGYADAGMLAAVGWAKWHQKRLVLMSDSKADDAIRHPWKEEFKRGIVRQYDAAIVAGKPQYRYMTQLGMPPEKIFFGFDVVGNESFHPDRIRALPNPHPRPFFLTISRFVPKKNLLMLLETYADYVQQKTDLAWDLVLCGDGELRSQIEQRITALGLHGRVLLPGFLQQAELLPYFAHARCLIQASRQEQWGLVVNEAMAAGLPVIVSDRCGCYEDLVVESINGFGFDPDQPEQLSFLMQKMSSPEIDTAAMQKAALAQIEKFSPEYFADQLRQAIQVAIKF